MNRLFLRLGRCHFNGDVLIRDSLGAHIVLSLVFILFLLLSRQGNLFLFGLRGLLGRLLSILCSMRCPFFNIIFYFVENICISLNAVLMIVNIIFLRLTSPRIFANHIHVGVCGLFEFLILLKGMLLKTIHVPS